MKKITTLLLLLLLICSCQNDKISILQKSVERSKSIQNGIYTATKQLKMISDVDTLTFSMQTRFEKDYSDSIYGFKFNSLLSEPRMGEIRVIYSNGELSQIVGDSIGSTMSNSGFDLKKNPAFRPFTLIESIDIYPIEVVLNDKSIWKDVELVGTEKVNNWECYLIELDLPAHYSQSALSQVGYLAGLTYRFWIKRDDYTIVQHSVTTKVDINGQALEQYEKHTLTDYEFNNLGDSSCFDAQGQFKHIDFLRPEPLRSKHIPLGSTTPEWRGLSATGNEISSSDYQGKLLLIDFFFTSCPPCIESLPFLTSLNRKYRDEGLEMCGINTLVIEKENIDLFIKEHNIEYPIISNGISISNLFNCYNYPTTYLIDRDGTVLYRHSGSYSSAEEKRLERLIKENL